MPNLLFSPPLPKGKGDHIHWGNLHGSSLSLVIANAAKQHKGISLLITADTPSAIRLEKELHCYLQGSELSVSLFPDWEILPYDHFSPHQDIVSQRLESLYQLSQNQSGIFIVPVDTLMLKMAPTDYLKRYLLKLTVGQQLHIDDFRSSLANSGYQQVDQVMGHSEYAVRGSLIDLFPMGCEHPFRIDLLDDEIDSIRYFDPENQRSADEVNRIDLLPAREFPTDKPALSLFKQQYMQRFEQSGRTSMLSQVTKGMMPGGIEYFMPLFFESTATLFDYLHPNSQLLLHDDLQQASERFWQDVQDRHAQYGVDPERPLLPPNDILLRFDELFAQFKHWPRVSLHTESIENRAGRYAFSTTAITDIALQPNTKTPWSAMQHQVNLCFKSDMRVLFCAESEGRRETLMELLARANIKPQQVASVNAFIDGNQALAICVAQIENSFLVEEPQQGFALITETELLGHKISQRRLREKRQATDENAIIRNLAELTIDQPIVHLDHGVGRYLGLQSLDAGGINKEYLCIEYAASAKLYVPVSSLHLVSRYTGGSQDHAPLHHLGTETWAKTRKKAAEKVRDVAAQLLEIYAKRAAREGRAHHFDMQEYQSFADSFPFEETEDQIKAIHAIIEDMRQQQPMDRLVCGDVGFGKTEVAMRAAFLAASGGRQVAILVPTTLLAQQHYENFRDRFANWPFRIQVMSRFVSSASTQQTVKQISDGLVDIVVGTHKLLQGDIQFADLGLVIIDEEHRFGVRQKDKFKALRADVDILTLTATPIPRTLNMALSGMRDLSIIATPPAKRLAIKTFVHQREDRLIREAIMREVLRGGQVYFLHNEVETIEKTAKEIAEIVPEVQIAIGHGQMRERELEQVMSDFYHQRCHVLVCTTIIETGIDVPSANTIIMDRADRLGLAQLHQLRGRVGRSHHQAYAYLLTPHPKRMTKDATKRLEAISALEDLGAGFALATHDLEIRGAGELLGEDQSGQIASVGFTLYMEMLEQAVEAIKQGKDPADSHLLPTQTDIELGIPALFPEDYIADVNVRLSLYKRLAGCQSEQTIQSLQIELIDRFGLLPEAAKNLMQLTHMKLLAKAIGIRKIDANNTSGSIEFTQETQVDPEYIIQLIQHHPRHYSMQGPNRLKFTYPQQDNPHKLEWLTKLLLELQRTTRAAI